MVEFETIEADRVEFGTRNFIAVSRKAAIADDGRHEFISVARGYCTKDGHERWKTNLTVPEDPDVLRFLIARLSDQLDAVEGDD